MDTSEDELTIDAPGVIRVFKDGRFERSYVTNIVPAGIDPSTGVNSKDVVYSPETNMFVRLYVPKTATTAHKLPLLIFIHGGGFVVESAASSLYHNLLNLVVSEFNVVAVSVEYRLAPEFHLPIAYEDSWEAIKWAAEHVNGNGPEMWLNEYADFQNVFLAGDSAGGNIAHNMGIRVGLGCPNGMRFSGIILIQPQFWGKERVGTESEWMATKMITHLDNFWVVVNPGSSGLDDPLINPGNDPRISGMGCSKMLVYVSGKDFMRDRGWNYIKLIEISGWKGELDVMEDFGYFESERIWGFKFV